MGQEWKQGAVIQAKDFNFQYLGWSWINESGKKLLDFECVLEINPFGVGDRLIWYMCAQKEEGQRRMIPMF